MPIRTILASRIAHVSEDAPSVLKLYQEIAEETGLAAAVNDHEGVARFQRYGEALVVMTEAYPTVLKEEIHVGLEVMRDKLFKDEKLPEALFVSAMERLQL